MSPAYPALATLVAYLIAETNRLIPGADLRRVREVVELAAGEVRRFAPGYEILAATATGDRVTISLHVIACSDVLPPYAGNLDLINSAAIMVAEQHAIRRTLTEAAL